MVITVLVAAFCFTLPPLIAAVMRAARGLPPPPAPGFFFQWGTGGLGGMAASAITAVYTGEWAIVLSFGASGLTGLVLWWHSRRKRRKVVKLIGEKARAVLAKMARSMPRPSPRLVPQGARG